MSPLESGNRSLKSAEINRLSPKPKLAFSQEEKSMVDLFRTPHYKKIKQIWCNIAALVVKYTTKYVGHGIKTAIYLIREENICTEIKTSGWSRVIILVLSGNCSYLPAISHWNHSNAIPFFCCCFDCTSLSTFFIRRDSGDCVNREVTLSAGHMEASWLLPNSSWTILALPHAPRSSYHPLRIEEFWDSGRVLGVTGLNSAPV